MKLRLIDCPPFTTDKPSYEPGDCWYAREGPNGEYYWWSNHNRSVSPADSNYPEIAPEHAGKRPMVVVLPSGVTFCVHSPTYKAGKPGKAGWTVTGELPNVTVHPSINYGDPKSTFHWHGWLKDGVLK